MGKIKYRQSITSRTDFFYYAFRNILLVFISLLVISTVILFNLSFHSSATNSNSETDNLTLTLSTSCTLSSSVEEAHTASLNGGQYEDDIGITKVNAYCNDNNGYSIYAIGSSGDIDGNTDLISNINDNYNIHTGIYDSTSTSSYTPSSWSMKLSPGSGTGINPDTGASITVTSPTIRNNYDSYSIVPNVYTLVASRPSNTNMTVDTNASGSYFTTTYDIYASSLQPAGTYTGKVKYLMVHPQSNSNTISDIDAAFLAAGKQKVYSDENGSYFAMQDMTSEICSSVSQNGERTSTQLVDIRDYKIYWVTKLKDGHCWMTQNLDLDLNFNNTLNSNTTDLNVAYDFATGQYAEYSAGYTENNGIIYWTPASTANTINFVGSDGATVPDWATSNNEPYSANDLNDLGIGHNSLGNLYNWTASIASNNSASKSSNTFDNISISPQNSICPKGWRLYTASNQSGSSMDSTNEFARLNYIYNNNKTNTDIGLISSPLYFTYPGYIRGNALNRPNEMGIYWSSSNLNSRDAGRSYINETSVAINDIGIGNRGSGFSVRCVAR